VELPFSGLSKFTKHYCNQTSYCSSYCQRCSGMFFYHTMLWLVWTMLLQNVCLSLSIYSVEMAKRIFKLFTIE